MDKLIKELSKKKKERGLVLGAAKAAEMLDKIDKNAQPVGIFTAQGWATVSSNA